MSQYLTANERLDIELRNKGNADVERLLVLVVSLQSEIAKMEEKEERTRTPHPRKMYGARSR